MDKKTLFLKTLSILIILPTFYCGGHYQGGAATRIQKEKQFYIGSVPFEPPLLYQAQQEMVGPEADLAAAVAQKVGTGLGLPDLKPFWITRGYSTLEAALLNGEIDFIISLYGITDSRKEALLFSDPYYESELVLVINPIHKDLRSNGLDGQKIGVREGTAVASRVEAKFADDSTIVPMQTLDDAVLALKRGEVDAVIDDRYMAAFSLATTPGVAGLEIIPGAIDTIEVAVALRKGDSDLLEPINAAISEFTGAEQYKQVAGEHIKDNLEKVLARHPNRLELAQKAKQPRDLTITVARDRGATFDIYRLANLSFVLTDRNSGQSHTTSRINFRGSTGRCSVKVPPGDYQIRLPKFRFSVGGVSILASDPSDVALRMRIQTNGNWVVTRS